MGRAGGFHYICTAFQLLRARTSLWLPLFTRCNLGILAAPVLDGARQYVPHLPEYLPGHCQLGKLKHQPSSMPHQTSTHLDVSERLGHASVTITMDISSYVVTGIQMEAAEKFSRVLSDSPGGLSG